MQYARKRDLIAGFESMLCLVANNTWDGRKIQNTETILYKASNALLSAY